jgi:hypothetical protein
MSYDETPCGAARVCSPKGRNASSVAASLILVRSQGARMTSKRSRRGRRIVSARKAAQWDEERIRRFEEDQRRKRESISFVEIADWYSDLGGPVSPKKAAALREQAYSMLERDLLAGNFEEGGRSQVLFLFPGVTNRRMTRQRLQESIDNNYDGRRGRSYLENCWLPRKLFQRWCGWHHLPQSAARFRPSQEMIRAPVSPEGAKRSPEPPMPVPILVPLPASKLVVDAVDQPEVSSGIQPREVRVPPQQDGGERRGIVAHKDSSLASDERLDHLDTQPSKPSNKGGRPPAVDWEALKDPLVEQIKIYGFPEPGNPPGWRGTKDVVDWATAKLRKESQNVAHRTIEDNVRKMLREIKDSAKPVSR